MMRLMSNLKFIWKKLFDIVKEWKELKLIVHHLYDAEKKNIKSH